MFMVRNTFTHKFLLDGPVAEWGEWSQGRKFPSLASVTQHLTSMACMPSYYSIVEYEQVFEIYEMGMVA